MGGSRREPAEQRASSAADRLAPYRFKPGQSGNPAGRKSRGKTLEELAERILRERRLAPSSLELKLGRKLSRLELVARMLVAGAEAGDPEALRMLADRLWPKPNRLELEVEVHDLEAAERKLNGRVLHAFQRFGRRDAESSGSPEP